MSESVHIRRSTWALSLLALLSLALAAALAHSWLMVGTAELNSDSGWPPARLTRALGLTDLALFTEARYTRHPAVADLFTPFQDAPLTVEHFPTGSLISPPPHLPASGRLKVEAAKTSAVTTSTTPTTTGMEGR